MPRLTKSSDRFDLRAEMYLMESGDHLMSIINREAGSPTTIMLAKHVLAKGDTNTCFGYNLPEFLTERSQILSQLSYRSYAQQASTVDRDFSCRPVLDHRIFFHCVH